MRRRNSLDAMLGVTIGAFNEKPHLIDKPLVETSEVFAGFGVNSAFGEINPIQAESKFAGQPRCLMPLISGFGSHERKANAACVHQRLALCVQVLRESLARPYSVLVSDFTAARAARSLSSSSCFSDV